MKYDTLINASFSSDSKSLPKSSDTLPNKSENAKSSFQGTDKGLSHIRIKSYQESYFRATSEMLINPVERTKS